MTKYVIPNIQCECPRMSNTYAPRCDVCTYKSPYAVLLLFFCIYVFAFVYVIICSHPQNTAFLEVHGETVLHRSPKQLKQTGIYLKMSKKTTEEKHKIQHNSKLPEARRSQIRSQSCCMIFTVSYGCKYCLLKL